MRSSRIGHLLVWTAPPLFVPFTRALVKLISLQQNMPLPSHKEPPFLNLGINRPDEQIYIGRAHNLPTHFRGQLHRHTHYELMWLERCDSVFFCDCVVGP